MTFKKRQAGDGGEQFKLFTHSKQNQKKNKFDHVYLNKTRVIKTRRLQFKGVYATLGIHFILTRER